MTRCLLVGSRPLALALGVALGLLSCACRERPHEPGSTATAPLAVAPAAAPASSASSASASAPEPSRPFRFGPADRLVAIGDLHGDLAATRSALQLAGAIDATDQWVGGKLVVVQTGDQLDRGDDERAILDLLDRLTADAAKTGGAVHVLNGNHETMNVAADFRYVTPGGFAAFADVTANNRVERMAQNLPEPMRGRARAFLPGGPFARRLAERNTVIVVGRTVFAHGGVLPAHVDYGLGRFNEEVRRWMNGTTPQPPALLVGEQSPVWTRRYSDGELSSAVCAELGGVLGRLEADRMVVGHTVQKSGISSACDGRVWRIDVGLAHYYGGTAAALEIAKGQVQVLTRPE